MLLQYGLIDAARDDRLYELVAASRAHACLFAGELDPELERAAPYIVRLTDDSPLCEAWRDEGRGQSWGIQCTSTSSLAEVRRHFRHFLQAKLPDGTVALFRFYDPRVFRTYLPTCTPHELAPWFLEVSEYRVEAEDGSTTICYSLWNGELKTTARGFSVP